MPRGRPKLIGPRLPTGGYRSLKTKKKLAETAAFYALMSAKMMSGANKQKRASAPYKTIKGPRGRPSKKNLVPMIPYYLQNKIGSASDSLNSTAATPKVKRTATAKQLAALVKARAARAAKRKGGKTTLAYVADELLF